MIKKYMESDILKRTFRREMEKRLAKRNLRAMSLKIGMSRKKNKMNLRRIWSQIAVLKVGKMEIKKRNQPKTRIM